MAQSLTHPATLRFSRLARSLPLLLVLMLGVLGVLGLPGCSKAAPVVDGLMPVQISGRTFKLEVVADDDSRTVGLGGRKEMAPDHGMLFSFPDSRLRRFVMRDCYIDIDIIFLDSAGRIVAMHAMTVEEDRAGDESQYQYEMRLEKYSSRFNAQYAIELLGGTLKTLGLRDGQLIEFDRDYLQSITR